jgi:quinoprotein relay system zinc metallohydrolase 2
VSKRIRRAVRAAACVWAAAGACVAAAGDDFRLDEIAPGVYVHVGQVSDFSPDNDGDIANLGAVVGERCAAVIDTGGSLAVGRRFRDALAARTAVPVCYVVNTHVHPDHVFGNAAFRRDGVEFVGHARLPAAFAQKGAGYARALARNVGPAADGSEVVPPGRTVSDVLALDLGGRTLTLRAWRTAHTDNDLTAQDSGSGVLFLSDLLFVAHTPVVDGSLKGWIDVLRELKASRPTAVVPGHGPVPAPWPAALDDEARYLDVLLSGVRAALAANKTIQQAVDSVGLDEAGRWRLFDAFHRRNVTASYAELEWEN